MPPIQLNLDFYLDPANTAAIKQNIVARHSEADIDRVLAIHRDSSAGDIVKELVKVPNMSHTMVKDLDEPRLVYQKDYVPPTFTVRSFEEISKILGGSRLQNLAHFSGERTYYLIGVLAELEQALIQWTVDKLLQKVII